MIKDTCPVLYKLRAFLEAGLFGGEQEAKLGWSQENQDEARVSIPSCEMSKLLFLFILLHLFLHSLLIHCPALTYYVSGTVLNIRETELKEKAKPLPWWNWRWSGSLVIIIVYPTRLPMFPRLVEFINNYSNRMVTLYDFPSCILLKRTWNSLKRGCTHRDSLAISHRLFSLEIGWPRGVGIKECAIRRVINRGKLGFRKFLCAGTRRCPCNLRGLSWV